MSSSPRANAQTFAGLFLVTLATVMFEVLLTRIFSVTLWYHYAFMAISIAMFGLTAGGLAVYLIPRYASPEAAKARMTESGFSMACSSIAAILFHTYIPCLPAPTLQGLVSVGITYFVISIPFVFGGICVCLALTKFPDQIGTLYGVDLAGAATGCVLLILILKVTDGVTAVFGVALFAAFGAALFAWEARSRKWQWSSMAVAGLVGIFVVANTEAGRRGAPLVRLEWAKGLAAARPLYEKWNSFSRVTVTEDPFGRAVPDSEGISPVCMEGLRVPHLNLTIDSSAETTLIEFHGDWAAVQFLKCDLKDLAFQLWPGRRVLIVGAGGGRDVLAALVSGEKAVEAVEINQDIIRAVNQRYGDYTGHLDRDPAVSFVNDEARSYIARSGEQFGIIQISFIDTWAATAAGALSLTENSVYTVEAWTSMLGHLAPDGVLSISRWYVPGTPLEAYRLVSLAATTLKKLGVQDPRSHLMMIRNVMPELPGRPNPAASTLLVSKAPFSEGDLARIESLADRLRFEVLLGPRIAAPIWAALSSGALSDQVLGSGPVDLTAPTDDRPFFFQMFPLRSAWRFAFKLDWVNGANAQTVAGLFVLLIVVIVLTLACLILPMLWRAKRTRQPGAFSFSTYFAAIGMGFMLVEVSQMERLIIFLGHPTYALSTVLFTLLLSAGLGSRSTERLNVAQLRRRGSVRLGLLLVALAVLGAVTPLGVRHFAGSSTPARIFLAVGILFPLGFFMGMAFPLGMMAVAASSEQPEALTPWFWGINGATSVLGSVLAVAIALAAGIHTSFWTGFATYALALLAFFGMTDALRRPTSPQVMPTGGTP